MEHDVIKALEVWTLQNILNVAIALGLLACGLAMIQGYYRSLEKLLSLRVSIELWKLFTVLMVDILLTVVVLIGYLVLNPDIMSDVKMAVPFFPVATILFAVALVLRLFYRGHDVASKNYLRALYLMLAANLLNVVGFTFVVEAASDEYLSRYPSAAWTFCKTYLRSNADPHGIDFSQQTFNVTFPILLVVLAWGAWSGLRRLRAAGEE